MRDGKLNNFLFIILFLLSWQRVFSLSFSEEVLLERALYSIRIDGKLENQEWQNAYLVEDFYQIYPDIDKKPSQKAEVRLLYDENFLYISFLKNDNHIKSASINRDETEFEDSFEIILSPKVAERSGYGFRVNPIGTQTDFLVLNDGKDIDYSWDSIWFSAVSKTEHAYTIELAIPFKVMFLERKEENRIGIIITFSDTLSSGKWEVNGFSAQKLSYENYRQISASVVMVLHGIRTGKVYNELIPFVSFEHNYTSQKPEGKFGLDFNSKIGSNISTEITLNPDYAQIEADVDRFNLDRANLLYYPEKRLFYSQNSEILKTPINLFYTRTLMDTKGGGKFSLRTSSFDILFLLTRTNSVYEEDLFNLGVSRFRYKRKNVIFGLLNILNNSQNKEKVFSADTTWFIGSAWQISGQFARSFNNGDDESNAYDISITKLFTNPKFDFGFSFDWTRLGSSFNCVTSFLPYGNNLDQKNAEFSISYIPSKYIKEIFFYSQYLNWNFLEPSKSFLRQYHIALDTLFTSDISLQLSHNENRRFYDNQYYYNKFSLIKVIFGAQQRNILSIGYMWGDNFGSRFKDLGVVIYYYPIDLLRLTLIYERFEFNNYKKEIKNLTVLNTSCRLAPKFFFRTFYQRSDITNSTDLNLLLQYEFAAGRNFYLVLNKGRDYLGAKRNAIFVKLAYGFPF